jgi:hypothetical protein
MRQIHGLGWISRICLVLALISLGTMFGLVIAGDNRGVAFAVAVVMFIAWAGTFDAIWIVPLWRSHKPDDQGS